uniref:Dynein regulatory complex subunit 4 n=1 Tax=Eptatretus burgeri TaxID=7764 RepID=A0A8C4Q8T3_EPTBU
MVTFRQRCGLNYPRRRMGPKKKAGGGKKKKKDAPGKDIGILSALSTQEMTKEQLEQQVLQLREELKKEQEERNYFQLERDKIHTFWEITRKQLEEKRAEMRNKDKEMEDAEERHQVEIKVYKQKVKHLLFEQQNSLAEVQIDATVKMKVAEEKYRENEVQLRKHLNRRKLQMKEQEMASSDVVKNVKMKHTETMSHLRDDFNRQVSEIETKYKEKMHQLQEELKLQRKTDLHELEENKNGQINSLVKCHEKSFSDMKNYYNDITLNNLSVINTLKEQLQKSKKHEERMEREMLDLNVQKRQVVDRLEKAQGELVELRKDLENYTKDKRLLANNKVRIKVLEAEKKELKWEMEVLEQRFDKVEEERDELRGHFVTTLNEVQQCSNLQSIVLERKLAALETTLEKKDAQLDKVLSTCNLAPEDVTVVTQKVEDVLDYKNGAIKQLQFELARACKAHNDLLRAYKEKLAAQGLPQVAPNFKPLKPSTVMQDICKAPASLQPMPS